MDPIYSDRDRDRDSDSECNMKNGLMILGMIMLTSILMGCTAWEIADLFFDASSETAETIGYSTAGGFFAGYSLGALIFGYLYMEHHKNGNSVRNSATHETTERTESAETTALLSRETFEAQESIPEAPNPASPKRSSIASMLTSGYGATPQPVESPYEANTPVLDVTNTAFQC